jgi:hypothetical protein
VCMLLKSFKARAYAMGLGQDGRRGVSFFPRSLFFSLIGAQRWQRLYACSTLRQLMFWLRPDRLLRVSLRRCLRPPRLTESGVIVLQREQGTSASAGVVFVWIADEEERANWFADLMELWQDARTKRKAPEKMNPLKLMLVEIGMAKWYEPLTEMGISIPSDLAALEKSDFEKLKMTPFEKSKLLKHVYSSKSVAKQ